MRLLLPVLAAVGLCAMSAHADPARPIVWIDAGHGGVKDGAIGPEGQKEKAIALQIALRLRTELESRGAVEVRLTRDSDADVDLVDRIRAANEAKADLFVSVHCNSMPEGRLRDTARGIETYFLSADATGSHAKRVAALENAEARTQPKATGSLSFILDDLARTQAHHDASALAYAVHARLVKGLRAKDRGVQQAPFLVLMGARMPAVLAEVGFLSHAQESAKLGSNAYQRRIARALADGVEDFLAEQRRRSFSAGGDGAGGVAVEP